MNSKSSLVYVLTTDDYFRENFPELKYLKSHNDIESIIEKDEITVLLFSYPHIIPKRIYKEYRIVNIHNSLLPKYRGMHAFTWALIHGETEIGYTAHLVDVGIDAGPILSQVSFEVEEEDDINIVFIKARRSCFDWLKCIVIPKLQTKNWQKDLVPQDHSKMTYFPKRNEKMSCIDWGKRGVDIVNLIRAVAPPYTSGAYSFVKKNRTHFCKVHFQEKVILGHAPNGTVLAVFSDKISIKVMDGILIAQITSFDHLSSLITVGDIFENS